VPGSIEAASARRWRWASVSANVKDDVVSLPGSFGGTLLRAFIALGFGIILVAWPSATLRVFLVAFGIFALCFGAFELIANFGEEERPHRWVMVIFAIISAVAGIFALAWPSASTRIILAIVGIWAIGVGFIELVAGMGLPREFSGKWLLVLFSIISIGIGVWLLVRPEQKGSIEVASVVVTVLGLFAIIEGLLLAVYAFLLRKFIGQLKKAAA
jgi:uncharacterized membrane protein HdeD (DUF308 family)